MDDTIRRKEAIHALINETLQDGAYGYIDGIGIENILTALPSARHHGKWIPLEEEIGLYACSICGHRILRKECHYCPHCGARMDLDEVME